MSVVDLKCGLDELLNAIPDYREAAEYYDADIDEIFGSAKVRRMLAKSEASSIRLNFAKTPVDALVNRLEITAVNAVGGNDSAGTALEALYEANDLAMEIPDWLLNASKYGDAYVMIDGDKETGVDLFYNSPLTCRIIYSIHNPRKKAFAIKRWIDTGADGKPYVRVDLLYVATIERYVTKDTALKGTKAEEFVPLIDEELDIEDGVIENPFGFIPMYHLRNARPYGRPEHKDAYGPQDAINKLAITQISTVDFQGAPQRWALAADGTDTDDADDFDDDENWDLANPEGDGQPAADDGRRHARHERSTLEAGAGTIMFLKNIKEVGQFDVADPDNFIDPATFYVRVMAQTTTTPLHYFDPSGEVPSGESLRAADAPLNKKARNRQMAYTGTIKEVLTDALKVLGYDGVTVVINWASVMHYDDIDAWNMVKTKIEAGVPVWTALSEAGYSDKQLLEWKVPSPVYAPPVEQAIPENDAPAA